MFWYSNKTLRAHFRDKKNAPLGFKESLLSKIKKETLWKLEVSSVAQWHFGRMSLTPLSLIPLSLALPGSFVSRHFPQPTFPNCCKNWLQIIFIPQPNWERNIKVAFYTWFWQPNLYIHIYMRFSHKQGFLRIKPKKEQSCSWPRALSYSWCGRFCKFRSVFGLLYAPSKIFVIRPMAMVDK